MGQHSDTYAPSPRIHNEQEDKDEAEARKIEAIRRRKRNRTIAAGVVVLALAGIAYGWSAVTSMAPDPVSTATWNIKAVGSTDIAMGDPKAPARITEHGSLTCVHCADFHEKAFGDFKRDFIDTGKVYFVYSHFPYDAPSLQAATAVACLPKQRQADALVTLYRNQSDWASQQDITGTVINSLKLSPDETKAAMNCVTDGRKGEQVTKRGYEARNRGIASTPTFIINDGVYEGFMSSEVLGKIALDAKP